jgi:hypothetical protein
LRLSIRLKSDPGRPPCGVQLHTELKPQWTVEIGLGYGFSTVFLMMAIQRSEHGHHILAG